ncbi:hypothetical protein B0H34DRAFT_860480 [Crassisporium funariophilum]|nr:hypothetical protein B0H34DRAFT_860480 [Crassisporium funariophilum]
MSMMWPTCNEINVAALAQARSVDLWVARDLVRRNADEPKVSALTSIVFVSQATPLQLQDFDQRRLYNGAPHVNDVDRWDTRAQCTHLRYNGAPHVNDVDRWTSRKSDNEERERKEVPGLETPYQGAVGILMMRTLQLGQGRDGGEHGWSGREAYDIPNTTFGLFSRASSPPSTTSRSNRLLVMRTLQAGEGKGGNEHGMGRQGARHMYGTYQGRRSGCQSTSTIGLSRWRRARGPKSDKGDSEGRLKDAGSVRGGHGSLPKRDPIPTLRRRREGWSEKGDIDLVMRTLQAGKDGNEHGWSASEAYAWDLPRTTFWVSVYANDWVRWQRARRLRIVEGRLKGAVSVRGDADTVPYQKGIL